MPRSASRSARFVARAFDRALPPQLLTDPNVRMRARVLLGGASTFLLLGAMTIAACLADGRSISAIPIGISALCHLLAIAVLRWRGSIEGGTFLVGFGVVFSTAFFAAQEGGLYVATTAWIASVPLLTAFLAGGRNALIAAVVVVLAMTGVWLLHANGMALKMWVSQPLEYAPVWVATISAHFVVAFFAWRYADERATTLEQLNETVAGLEEHRNRLVSVLESADASIVSTDRELRIIALNTAGRALSELNGNKLGEGDSLLKSVPPEDEATWRARFERVLTGETLSLEYRSKRLDRDFELSIRPVGEGVPTGLTIFLRDVTDRKEAMHTLAEARREMIELSRVAGMADVATGVLHNVGNALNSAKTSAHVVQNRLADMAKPRLARLVELLPEDRTELARFVAEDPRGAHVVRFLSEVAAQAKRGTDDAIAEIERLDERLDHIKHIVSEQQGLAKRKRVVLEECDPRELVRIAIDMTAGRAAGNVVVEHDADLPRLIVDRHKVIQILGNFIANARESARDAGVAEPRIAIRTKCSSAGVSIEVEDNGIGMDRDTLARVFEHGFTTKSYGHGFGLHTAANQTDELGGKVSARSDGLGKGATFVLELPLQPPADVVAA